MSELLSEVGRSEESLVYARRAFAISPAALALTANLAERLAWSGAPRAAIDILDHADAVHPKSAILTSSRLSILLRTGNLAGARALLDHAAPTPGFLGDELNSALIGTGFWNFLLGDQSNDLPARRTEKFSWASRYRTPVRLIYEWC